MIKKHLHFFLFLFLLSVQAFGAGSRIRINQLGYLPNGSKKAVLISESATNIQEFSILDALTNETYATLNTVQSWGSFDKFNSNFILDFSSFKQEGAFYIKVGDTYSPTVYIHQNIFINTTNQLITYLQSQRLAGDEAAGWWYDASNKISNASVNASVTYQLLFIFSKHPEIFDDEADSFGKKQPNGIPDLIEEAKWGIDQLLRIDYESTKVAVAAKFAAVFALGSDVLRNFYPELAEKLAGKSAEIYQYAKAQDVVFKGMANAEDKFTEENWKDDMQLAATQLYFLTFNEYYLKDAQAYGLAEPLPQWLFASCDKPLQFYPYINWSPYLLMQIENPQVKKNYQQNMNIALQRALLTACDNPFHIGINLSENSNNKIAALHNLCHAYRKQTNDSTFIEMEEALFNWIFGCNPWGISMVTKLPENGITPLHPHAKSYIESDEILAGAMVNGAVSNHCLKDTDAEKQIYDGAYERYQTDWAIYHDHVNDYVTNQPNIDGTVALLHMLSVRQAAGEKKIFFDKNNYDRGGINRFNPEKKQLTIIFTGHQYADGYRKIKATLDRHNVKAAFFFSGDFLRKPGNARKIKKLKEKGHYIGLATNHYEKLAEWSNAESSGIRKNDFLNDLRENYAALKKHGIGKQQAPFFSPPFELYNDSISKWCKNVGVYLIRSTPGTYSNLDYTFPEMRENYYSSKEIMDRIMQVQQSNGLNGYILQFHFGTNPGRKDKFYNSLSTLLGSLKNAGYEIVDIFTAMDLVSKPDEYQPNEGKNNRKKVKN
ncbi:MAG: glycoside hydrolase family 9 protein [Paludibacter sp.]|nr:glycoside hydrolase family 9 protein [Paludibacter sp.]MDD4427040.1 glycoside hydrolase family 9 protein [Paludibacter sp.]